MDGFSDVGIWMSANNLVLNKNGGANLISSIVGLLILRM